MRKVLIGLVLLASFVWIPTLAWANVTVSISDGVTTITQASGKTAFLLSQSSPAGTNTTLVLLTCATKPCTAFFPSGASAVQTGDTFKIQDISSTNLARIEKTDVPAGGTATTGADSVVLRGIKITATSAGAGKTFTLRYQTASGDLSTITSTSGNYAGSAKIKGQFRKNLSGTEPVTCDNGVSSPCAQLSVIINLLPLNGIGSNLSTLITASIPCSTDSTSTSPCGSGGFWSPSLLSGDQFLSTDTGSVGCGLTCAPVWDSKFSAKFNAANDVFTLTTSAGSALAQDNLLGLIELAVLLGEPGIDVWVGSCGGVQTGALPYLVTGQPPFGNKGRNQSDSATFPMKFSLQKGQLQKASGGFPFFESIDDPSETVLPAGDRERNNSCSMSWVPSPSSRPKFSQITQLDLNFSAFVTGCADSGNSLLSSPDCGSQAGELNFNVIDCTACFRVEIQLVDASVPPVDQGTLVVYLGADAIGSYRTGYAAYTSRTSLTLVSDATNPLRVDASGTSDPQPCCISFAEAQKNSDYGKLFVRAITAVIDPGLDTSLNPLTDQGNHLVTNLGVVVNASNRAAASSSNDSMLTVGNFQPSCDWPPVPGLKIYVYQVQLNGDRTFVGNVVNPTIDPLSCNLTASFSVAGLGTGTYEADVVAYSAATDPLTEFIGGIFLPDPGIMILK